MDIKHVQCLVQLFVNKAVKNFKNSDLTEGLPKETTINEKQDEKYLTKGRKEEYPR